MLIDVDCDVRYKRSVSQKGGIEGLMSLECGGIINNEKILQSLMLHGHRKSAN